MNPETFIKIHWAISESIVEILKISQWYIWGSDKVFWSNYRKLLSFTNGRRFYVLSEVQKIFKSNNTWTDISFYPSKTKLGNNREIFRYYPSFFINFPPQAVVKVYSIKLVNNCSATTIKTPTVPITDCRNSNLQCNTVFADFH